MEKNATAYSLSIPDKLWMIDAICDPVRITKISCKFEQFLFCIGLFEEIA
jgi:hypothetical protein